jgi:predicted metal-dependent hydrolase
MSAPRVEVRRSARRRRTVTAYRDQDAIVVLLPARMTKAQEKVYVAELVAKVLAREARTRAPRTDDDLTARAAELSTRYLAPVLGHAPRPTSVVWVGNQHRRWGSCTVSTGAVRLSDRLRPLPSWVVDYVLLHELVHLVEPAHSPRFWSLLAAFPQAERARGFLDGFHAAGSTDAPPEC